MTESLEPTFELSPGKVITLSEFKGHIDHQSDNETYQVLNMMHDTTTGDTLVHTIARSNDFKAFIDYIQEILSESLYVRLMAKTNEAGETPTTLMMQTQNRLDRQKHENVRFDFIHGHSMSLADLKDYVKYSGPDETSHEKIMRTDGEGYNWMHRFTFSMNWPVFIEYAQEALAPHEFVTGLLTPRASQSHGDLTAPLDYILYKDNHALVINADFVNKFLSYPEQLGHRPLDDLINRFYGNHSFPPQSDRYVLGERFAAALEAAFPPIEPVAENAPPVDRAKAAIGRAKQAWKAGAAATPKGEAAKQYDFPTG